MPLQMHMEVELSGSFLLASLMKILLLPAVEGVVIKCEPFGVWQVLEQKFGPLSVCVFCSASSSILTTKDMVVHTHHVVIFSISSLRSFISSCIRLLQALLISRYTSVGRLLAGTGQMFIFDIGWSRWQRRSICFFVDKIRLMSLQFVVLHSSLSITSVIVCGSHREWFSNFEWRSSSIWNHTVLNRNVY